MTEILFLCQNDKQEADVFPDSAARNYHLNVYIIDCLMGKEGASGLEAYQGRERFLLLCSCSSFL